MQHTVREQYIIADQLRKMMSCFTSNKIREKPHKKKGKALEELILDSNARSGKAQSQTSLQQSKDSIKRIIYSNDPIEEMFNYTEESTPYRDVYQKKEKIFTSFRQEPRGDKQHLLKIDKKEKTDASFKHSPREEKNLLRQNKEKKVGTSFQQNPREEKQYLLRQNKKEKIDASFKQDPRKEGEYFLRSEDSEYVLKNKLDVTQ